MRARITSNTDNFYAAIGPEIIRKSRESPESIKKSLERNVLMLPFGAFHEVRTQRCFLDLFYPCTHMCVYGLPPPPMYDAY